ncbi:hypothetical protein AB1Y20_020834 [Prymnesium parvum]|uniref:Ion transport domain-containing protein n=1 Tax=Prymnesium parvum TaxID=97485 RepID=A0AB34JWF1_PRYPA
MCPPRLAPQRGQSAWVKTESGTYSSGMILECDEDSITLQTQSGIQVAPLEQCIHVGSIRKGATASAFAKLLRGGPAPPAHHVQGRSGRIYTGRAFGCLRPTDPLRKRLIDLIEWPPFDAAIMLTILANCTTMALESRVARPDTPMVLFLNACESAFLWVFSFEFACRAVAMGLLSTRSSYLRDGWCRLDFTVLVLAWLPLFFPSFGNYTAIRALRALRVLRALKWMPSMPALVAAIWAAMPRCGQVAVLCVFLFVLTGCTGLHLFAGEC